MDAVTTVALPVFALVGSGYAARALRLLDAPSIVGLNGFVYWFALPALLFVRIAETKILGAFDARLVAAWLAASLFVFAVAMLVGRLVFGHGLARLGLQGLTATFGNVGYMGLPLVLTAFGRDATLPAVVILVTDIVVIVPVAVAIVEAGRGRGGRFTTVARTILLGLATNPIVLASLAGALVAAGGARVPAPLRAFGELLGAAALPCALFALGASLVGRLVAAGHRGAIALVGLKLVLHPVAVWMIAAHLIPLDPLSARVAVIEASLPTAATVFVLAQRYGLDVEGTSTAVLLSTVASVVTVSVLLALATS